MAINQVLVDTEGQDWDFADSRVVGGSILGTGLGVDNGENDTFDGGLVLSVNGVGINPLTAGLDFNGRELNTVPVFTTEGLAVTRSILVSDATISAIGFARFLDSFTNTTNADITFTVSWSSNSGADSTVALQATSSGDTTLTTADFGFVVDDGNIGGGDSAWGFAYGNGKMPPPSSATQSVGIGSSLDVFTIQHSITLKAGETKSLLSFAVQNDSSAASITDYTKFTRPLNDMRADNFLAGLSEREISQVQNYSYIGSNNSNGPLGLTVLTDGEGNRWGVNNNRMGVQTLDTDVLREANPGEVLFQNLKTNPTTLIAEDGQEATFRGSFGTTRTGFYSVMASPEDGFVRIMMRLDHTNTDPAAIFAGEYGLKAVLASAQNLVGDRNIDGSLGDGVLTIGDGGVVLDDSVSGGGGERPALTLVFGDTSTIDATNTSFPNGNDTEEKVQLSGNVFAATDGPPLRSMPFDTFALLYYIALNDDGLGGVADLAKLIRPDYKALAGLSAFEVSKIKNFVLTENDRLKTTTGDGGDNTIHGDYWGDQLNGGDGNDTLIGLGSDDELNGGGGNDVLLGGISNDALFGGQGNDLLDGGTGNDLMQGDEGNDTFIVDSASDKIIDAPAQGTLDWVKTSVNFDLSTAAGGGDPLEIERLSTTNDIGTADINLAGNNFAQIIVGNDGKNTIDGKGGIDRLEGRGGNDTYFVDNVKDLVIEAVGGGDDTVNVTNFINYALAAGQEIELLQALDFNVPNAMNLAGNEFGQRIIGTNGINIIYGQGGTDTLEGRGGNDIYYVDSADDRVLEAVGAGADTVKTSASWSAEVGQEIETIQANAGSTALTLTGNEFANSFISGAGNDTMIGLGGSDTYYVNNAGDQVTEAVGDGADTIKASVSWTAQAGQEIELIQANAGSLALTLTGNELANAFLSGAGNDTMIGLGGNDTYYVNNGGDVVNEAAGGGTNDVVRASVDYTLGASQEIETLLANAGATGLKLTGNNLNNYLLGGAGGDTLTGGLGRDSFTGAGGNDFFVFNAVAESAVATPDIVLDFTNGADKLDVHLIDADGNAANGDTAFVLDALGNNTFATGHIRQTLIGTKLTLDFNTDADAASEMAIVFQNHGLALGVGDLIA